MSDVTRILNAVTRREEQVGAELIEEVYHELRRLAAHKLAGERPDHTLQPTALVHEAWLRLTRNSAGEWNSRGHFFSAAAEAMRRILVDQARAKRCKRRGGEWRRVDLSTLDVAVEEDGTTVVLVDSLLDELGRHDPVAAEVVKLRFFAGLTYREAAVALGITKASAQRRWDYARAWLYDALSKQGHVREPGTSALEGALSSSP